MQNFKDYYDILGVPKDVASEEIKKVFRRLARQYHPDLNPGNKEAEEKFKDIGEAYEILGDPNKRSQYDRFSLSWQQKSRGKAGKSIFKRGTRETELDEFADFESFIDQVLGRNNKASNDDDPFRPGTTKYATTVTPRPSRRNIEAKLVVPLEKAYEGGAERIRLEDGRSLEVDMPPGMFTGQTIRLKEQGVGGGDLFLKITVSPHDYFLLEGNDIAVKLPITPSEAVLGNPVEVPTLDGLVQMNLPAGVKSGQRLRLANKGYIDDQGRRGDQLVKIQIVIPKTISSQEKELYEKLRQIETFNPRADLLLQK
ncbi:DnaJ C-terminal domain-containing protein [Synechocystis sp. PCC 7509]|uniref:DnaJ C-terminal domain-containing protein n=1 Tax=Synechocystis sp. PCC 7509 TaxID=927677 RepID=UPI00192C7316|nr:J domain-containing protein [Synechocystis sp. PCC 7509]